MAADGTQITAREMALAAYRDISAGLAPRFDLSALPEAAVISAALEHGDELAAHGRFQPRGFDGLADNIANASAHAARFSGEDR